MSRRNIVEYTKALIKAGVMKEPKWMYALTRTPPLPVGKPGKRPPSIVFPEDELVDAYYRKHPEARLEPVDMASFEPPTARRFALRQLHLIQDGGLSKKRAFAQAEQEFGEERLRAEAASGVQRQSVIDQIQAEEEYHLQQGLRQYAQRNGPLMVKQHARELWQASQGGNPAAARAAAANRASQLQQRQAAAKKQQAAQQQRPAAAAGGAQS